MNDIAIKYIRKEICEGVYAFTPIDVIEGKYNQETGIFTTVEGEECYFIYDTNDDAIVYFANLAPAEHMRTDTGAELTAEQFNELKASFYDKYGSEIKIAELSEDGSKLIPGEYIPPVEEATEYIHVSYPEFENYLSSRIVGQEKAVQDFATAIYKNIVSDDPLDRTHILLTGSKGSGKVEMVEEACKYLHMPFYKINVAEHTKEGIAPVSAEEILDGLLKKHHDVLESAQRGIILVNKLDKMLNTYGTSDSIADIFENQLIRLMERDVITLEDMDFDTSGTTVVVVGDFENIEVEEEPGLSGFNAEIKKERVFNDKYDYSQVGLSEDMLDLIDCVVKTKKVNVNDIKQYLRNSENSPLVKEIAFAGEKYDAEIVHTPKFVDAIANEVYASGRGITGIKYVLDKYTSHANREVMSGHTKKIKFSIDTIKNKKNIT